MQLSEIFYSLQGEGTTRGTPSVFIRFTGCNLTCGIDSACCDSKQATWVCDSYKVWNKLKKDYSNEEVLDLLQTFASKEDYLANRVHLVWTGGEPLLPKNVKAIKDFLNFAKESGFKFFSEIETNGTLFDEELFSNSYINLVNCSPKLSNSGIFKQSRIKESTIELLSSYNTYFKFVVTSKSQWEEIIKDFPFIPLDRIILMPGMDGLSDQSRDVSQKIWELAQEKRVLFSTREHIHVWNKLTGV